MMIVAAVDVFTTYNEFGNFKACMGGWEDCTYNIETSIWGIMKICKKEGKLFSEEKQTIKERIGKRESSFL